jgi:hypothetical protein
MKFGLQADQETKLAGTGGADFVKYLRENGEYRFRFLEEYPKGWTSFWEHFSNEYKCGYPCTRTPDCPGCNVDSEKEAKPTRRILTNAFLVSAPQKDNKGVGYASLWKLPAASVEPSIKRCKDSKDTVLDRDFTIVRYEESQVKYDVEREDPEEFDASKYTLKDHEQALQEAFDFRWDPEVRAAKQAEFEARKDDKAKKAAAEEVEVEHEEEPEVPYELKSAEERKAIDEAKTKAGRRLTVVNDEPEPEESISVTPNQIRKASVAELRKIYKAAGVDWIDSDSQKELAEHLLTELGAPVG